MIVADTLETDVLGDLNAGLTVTVWVNRSGKVLLMSPHASLYDFLCAAIPCSLAKCRLHSQNVSAEHIEGYSDEFRASLQGDNQGK